MYKNIHNKNNVNRKVLLDINFIFFLFFILLRTTKGNTEFKIKKVNII